MEYRKKTALEQGWKTIFRKSGEAVPELDAQEWKEVCLPHNWEDYQGYRCLSHGNLHGTAWYQNRFAVQPERKDHVFVEFEGAGSYLTLWCNGKYIGGHKGGRTCYTAELTEALRPEGENLLLARTDHPEKIRDLPWVCGGCWGTPNTEGSQPLGLFRPVSIYHTGDVRIEPFGVEVRYQKQSDGSVRLTAGTELRNLSGRRQEIALEQELIGPDGEKKLQHAERLVLESLESRKVEQEIGVLRKYTLWDLENPLLYQLRTRIWTEDDGGCSDETAETFGIRFLSWENFDDRTEEILDEALLMEKPSAENEFFVKRQKGKGNRAEIVRGGVRVRETDREPDSVVLEIETELENKDSVSHSLELESFVQTYNRTKSIADLKSRITLAAGERMVVRQKTERLRFLDRWSREKPYYYQVSSTLRDMETSLEEPMKAWTPFGLDEKAGLLNKAYPYRAAETGETDRKHRFFLNGKPVLLQGTCEYEHLLGCDHAFTGEQIEARMRQIRAAGFNALREAHCPHNLRYLEYCEKHGILYWAQMGAHLYFDTQDFRDNYENLMTEWVKERRNSPSLILWGLQNESLLPESFAAAMTERICELDFQTPKQRKTTTCNGGAGSNWNIPQNWSGTYGGDVENYGKEIRRQKLVGEYGQYRVLGLHEEGEMHEKQNAGGNVSEELFCYSLGTKLREMEKQKDFVCGHFQWIFSSHANPGRETVYCLDGMGSNAVGVVNNKGLLSCWGEPTDAFYMYRSFCISARREPMVYIVSHTWPDRFLKKENGDITVYSNCDEVALYLDYRSGLVGKKARKAWEPFVFRNVPAGKGLLYAVGYVDGREAAEDMVIPNGAILTENGEKFFQPEESLTVPEEGEYLYRVNCGGGEYRDSHGNLWSADREWDGDGFGWTSWAMEYENLKNDFASCGCSGEPIRNTRDQELFRTYRYGREKLQYHFSVEPGEYTAELYFTEPWYGMDGGDCRGWRLFDVALNGTTVFSSLDIWAEAGIRKVMKKKATICTEKEICLTFPRVKSYQAVISAVAISKKERKTK